MTAHEEAQRQIDAALVQVKQLTFQRSQLNKRSQLYAIRASGIDMQIAEAETIISTAQGVLNGTAVVEEEPTSVPEQD